MKECPICKAIAFDDARICYGCLHRFEEEALAETVPADLDERMDAWLGGGAETFPGDGALSEGGVCRAECAEPKAGASRVDGAEPPAASGSADGASTGGGASSVDERDKDGEGGKGTCSVDASAFDEDGGRAGSLAMPGWEQGPGGQEGWVMRIEFRSAGARTARAGSAFRRPIGGDDVVPRFAVTEDGFVVSVGTARRDAPSASSSTASAVQRRSAHSSRSILRRRSLKGSAASTGAAQPVEAAG